VAFRKPEPGGLFGARKGGQSRTKKIVIRNSKMLRRIEVCKYMDENSHFKSSQDD